MAVKIRLKRMGKIRAPFYRIVVADSRTKRDGRVIEEIGLYHPTENPSVIKIESERALYWLGVGAQPTEQVQALLKLTGDWGKFKGDPNAVSTVQVKEAKVEFVADEKKKPVLKPKAEKVDEAPAKDEAPQKDAAPAADEAPAEAPAKDDAPAKDEAPAKDDAPAKDETPAKDEAPAKDAPAKDEAPAKDAPAADEAADGDKA